MKRLLRKLEKSLTVAFVVLILAFTMSACGSEPQGQGKASAVTFDFQTGDYSFKGVDGATEYRVRIFPVTDGVEEDLPINETQPIRAGEESYTGNIALWSLTAGNTYNVYVLTKDEDGKSSVSDAVTGIYIATFLGIKSGVSATINGSTITVALDDDALKDTYAAGADYEIALKDGETVVETKTIASADIVATESSSGFMKTTTYDAKVTFEVVDTDASYTVTVKVISTSDYNISSEESEPFAITEGSVDPVEAVTGGEMPGTEK